MNKYLDQNGAQHLVNRLKGMLDNLTLLRISQADYDELENPDPNILYIVF